MSETQQVRRNYVGKIIRNLKYETKLLMKDLANHTCEVCHRKSDQLEIDHIIPMIDGGSDEFINLQVICYECHLKKTAFEARARNQRAKADMSESRSNG